MPCDSLTGCNTTDYPDGQEGGDCTYSVLDLSRLIVDDVNDADSDNENPDEVSQFDKLTLGSEKSGCGWPLGPPGGPTCALMAPCDADNVPVFADGGVAGRPYKDACKGSPPTWPYDRERSGSQVLHYESEGDYAGICPTVCRATARTLDTTQNRNHVLPPAGDYCNSECAFEACRFHAHACIQFSDRLGTNQFRRLGSLTGDTREKCARGATAEMSSVGAFAPLRALHLEALAAYTAALPLETDAERAAHEKEQRAALDARYFFTTTLSFPYSGGGSTDFLPADPARPCDSAPDSQCKTADCARGCVNDDGTCDVDSDHGAEEWDNEGGINTCEHLQLPVACSSTCVELAADKYADFAACTTVADNYGTGEKEIFSEKRDRITVVTCTNATHYAARALRDLNNVVKNSDPEHADALIETFLKFDEDYKQCDHKQIVWQVGGACPPDANLPGADGSPAPGWSAATCIDGFETRNDQLHARKFRVPNYGPHVADGADPGEGSNLLPIAVSGLNAAGEPIAAGHPDAAPALACAACRDGYVARRRARIADTYCNGAWLLLPVECIACPHPENCANSECLPGMDFLTMCETCVRGFYRSGTTCLPCGFGLEWLKELPVMFVAMLLGTGALVAWVKKGGPVKTRIERTALHSCGLGSHLC